MAELAVIETGPRSGKSAEPGTARPCGGLDRSVATAQVLGKQGPIHQPFGSVGLRSGRHGLPVAVCVESATPHEVKLAESTLLQMIIPEPPQNLIGDNAYDSDRLDTRLRSYGIELISLTAVTAETERKIEGACDGIADLGKLKDCLPGYRTFAGWLSVTNDTLRTFSGRSISAAA